METLNVEFSHISNRILNTLNSILKTGNYQQDQKPSEKLLCHKFIIFNSVSIDKARGASSPGLRISFNEPGREIDSEAGVFKHDESVYKLRCLYTGCIEPTLLSLVFDLGYLGDFMSWMFLGTVHEDKNTQQASAQHH